MSSFLKPSSMYVLQYTYATRSYCTSRFPRFNECDASFLPDSRPSKSSPVTPPRTFLAHRSVLAAASPYFRAMFTSDLAEATRARVVLKSVGDAALAELLDFVYTGRARITR